MLLRMGLLSCLSFLVLNLSCFTSLKFHPLSQDPSKNLIFQSYKIFLLTANSTRVYDALSSFFVLSLSPSLPPPRKLFVHFSLTFWSLTRMHTCTAAAAAPGTFRSCTAGPVHIEQWVCNTIHFISLRKPARRTQS